MLVLYMMIINMVGYAIMKIDKLRARRKQYRIRERTLWFVAFIGGAFGSFLAMKRLHHKTKKITFTYGMPLLVLFHIVLILILYAKFGSLLISLE